MWSVCRARGKTGAATGTRENGCGYGLHVPQRIDEAERLLREAGVRVLYRTDRGASS